MVLQFFMGYHDSVGVWRSGRKDIAMRYLHGWFWIDVMSILPFDIVGVVTSAADCDTV